MNYQALVIHPRITDRSSIATVTGTLLCTHTIAGWAVIFMMPVSLITTLPAYFSGSSVKRKNTLYLAFHKEPRGSSGAKPWWSTSVDTLCNWSMLSFLLHNGCDGVSEPSEVGCGLHILSSK